MEKKIKSYIDRRKVIKTIDKMMKMKKQEHRAFSRIKNKISKKIKLSLQSRSNWLMVGVNGI